MPWTMIMNVVATRGITYWLCLIHLGCRMTISEMENRLGLKDAKLAKIKRQIIEQLSLLQKEEALILQLIRNGQQQQ